MKRVFKIAVPVKPAQQIILVACLLITLFIPVSVLSQTDSTTAKASEGKSLISPTIEFISTQKGDNTIDLKAILKAKIKRTLTKLYGMKISFSSSDSSGKELGKIITDRNGMALLNYKADGITAGAEGKLHFKASFAGNKSAEAAEEELIQEMPRALWSPNPPLWMLITFIILVTVVWGHYIVIVYELFRLRKEQPKTNT